MLAIKGLLKQSGIISKLLLLLGATCFFTIIGIVFWKIFTNGDITDIKSLKLMQLVQSVGMFVIPPIVVAYLWSEKPILFLKIGEKMKWMNAIFIVVFMIIAIPFINLLGDFNQQMVLPKAFAGLEAMMKASELETAKVTEHLLTVHTLTGLLFNIFLIAMLPALGEELFFRGVLQRIFQEWKGAVAAIWISAFIFSAIHFQFYGFLPRLLLGAFFGYLLLWSDNLWLPILAHFINNLMAVVFFYLKYNGYQVFDIDTIGTGYTFWLGWISAFLVIVGVLLIKRMQISKSNSINI
ncbi:MAG: CPBP family intramembrane glutamic endopeptidase [Paludibacter sp.]